MAYTPLLHPTRGFMIERAQPFTTYDVNLVKQILDENDEVVIGIGNAGVSHEPGRLMSAGERMDVTDYVLRCEGIDANRFMLVPIENQPEATQWVAEVLMMTPRWDTFYTRNFKNAAMFGSFQRQYGFDIKRIDEQKPEKDYYAELVNLFRFIGFPNQKLSDFGKNLDFPHTDLSYSAVERMEKLGILHRVHAIYNRVNVENEVDLEKRMLFLGGFQPFTGVFADRSGHFGAVLRALEKREQVIIAVGSAQESYCESDPLTVGKRMDVIRYTLLANGVDSTQFFIVPIKDIAANACYAPKVMSLCPSFDAVIAGNDWTKQLFGEGDLEIISHERSMVSGCEMPLSATRVRKMTMELLKERHGKDDAVSESTVRDLEKALAGMIDVRTLEMLQDVGFYETMHFLAYAKD